MATVNLDPWATYSRQTDIKTLVEIMAGGFRYLRTTDGAATLADHTVQALTLTGATNELTMPTDIPEGRIGDFVLYVENSTGAEAVVTMDSGWGTTYGLATLDDAAISDLFTFAAGEKAVLYFTMSAFSESVTVGGETVSVPVWIVGKHAVTPQTAS